MLRSSNMCNSSFKANIDDCAGVKCHNGGKCVDDIDDFMCSCAPGYTGKYCQGKSNVLRPDKKLECINKQSLTNPVYI